jgi:hypothetical protein
MRRLPFATFALFFATASTWLPSVCVAQDATADRPTALQPQARSAEEVFTTQDSARLSLRPPVASLRERLAPAYGLSYHRESKSLLMPLDEKNEWSLGLNLNLNAVPNVETSPSSGLNLQPRRTPGLTFQKKF